MPEGEGQQLQPSQSEQGNTPAQKPETAQNGWGEHAALLAGVGKEEARLETPVSQENREVAEQRKELTENVQKLRDNLGQFSEDDPNIPASNETRQILNNVGEWTGEGTKYAKVIGGMAVLYSALGEGYNYFIGGGLPPGEVTAAIMGVGTLTAGVVKSPVLAAKAAEKMKKGYEKLKALVAKNKETRGNNS